MNALIMPCPECGYEIPHKTWMETNACPKCGWIDRCPQCGAVPSGANPNECPICYEISASFFGDPYDEWEEDFV